MKKEIINVIFSFGAIILFVFFGIFSYQKKDLLTLKVDEYENLAYEYDLRFDQIVTDRERRELEEKLISEQKEQETQEQLAIEEDLRLNQIKSQQQQADLLKKQQEAAAMQVAIEKARQQQLADQLAAEKARQEKLAADKAAAAKKASRKSRAS